MSVPPVSSSAKSVATRNDVARLAGVSTAVVSYVLNGSKRVSPQTAAKVHDAVAMLGYRPNQAARALRLGSPEMLGIVVPDATNAFFADLTHEVELAAEERGLALLTANADRSPERERRLVEKFVTRRVDGMLLSSTLAVPDARALVPGDVPFVLMNQFDDMPGVNTIGVNLFEGARLGVEHLASHGHRTVGLVSGITAGGDLDPREAGWRAAIEQQGLEPGPIVREPFTKPGGYAAGRWLIETNTLPRAMFVSSDQMAVGLLLALHESNIRVPDDVAIVSFDGTRDGEYSWPPLTSVSQPVRLMARAAVAVLVDGAPETSKQLFAPALVRRVSCGCGDHHRVSP
ncbi:MAG: LacI family DNA-binding transcriptional regulator [Actinobacteria bacterium]|nr:LacI family DNA-binding transcriptional regulator [Actinomycetota bacterium]